MKNRSSIGMGFLEKLIVVLFPIILGTIGWFLPKLLNFIKNISFFSEMKIFQLLNLFNPFWQSIILMFIGIVIGLLLSLTVYSEALKINITDEEILIHKDDHKKIIKKSKMKEIFMENNEVVITGHKGEELLREKTDIKKAKIREIFLFHHYPWCEQDPYADEYKLWTLQDHSLGEKINSILYERRNALREGDKRKVKNLRMDLNELGIVVKDQGENQYIRSIQK